jgi:hypothetical protein
VQHDAPRRLTVADTEPNTIYDAVPTLAALFGVSARTARWWIAEGKIRTLPRPFPNSHLRVLGSELLALLGDRQPVPVGATETQHERAARIAKTREEIRRLAKSRAGVKSDIV